MEKGVYEMELLFAISEAAAPMFLLDRMSLYFGYIHTTSQLIMLGMNRIGFK